MEPIDYLRARLAVLKQEHRDDLSPITERTFLRRGAMAEVAHAIAALEALK